MKLPIHAKGTLPISYDELYKEMPEDELEEALTCYAQARALTEEELGRPLTGDEFRLRARLYAEHQSMVRRYDPMYRIKANTRNKLYGKIKEKMRAKRGT
jgi:hypothetical protein